AGEEAPKGKDAVDDLVFPRRPGSGFGDLSRFRAHGGQPRSDRAREDTIKKASGVSRLEAVSASRDTKRVRCRTYATFRRSSGQEGKQLRERLLRMRLLEVVPAGHRGAGDLRAALF